MRIKINMLESTSATGRETEAPPPKSNELYARDAGNMGWARNKDAPKEAKSLRSAILRNHTLADKYSGDDRVYPVLHRLDRLYDDLHTMREKHKAAGAKKTAAKPAAKPKADVKELRQKVKEATAKLKLATQLAELKRRLNTLNVSDAQKTRYKTKIKAIMEKEGITRTPNYAAAVNELDKAKARLTKAAAKRK